MNEPDDTLREKLWQEYRDYKASISGGAAPATPASAPAGEKSAAPPAEGEQQPSAQTTQEGQ
jgi:hypothetical protein